jgi:hypothetical protein
LLVASQVNILPWFSLSKIIASTLTATFSSTRTCHAK